MTEAPGHPDDEPWGIGFGALLAHGANVDPTGGLDLLGGTPLQLGHAYQVVVHAKTTAPISLSAVWQLENAPAGVTATNTETLTPDASNTGSALLTTLGHTLVSLTATGGDATTSYAVAGSGQRPLPVSGTDFLNTSYLAQVGNVLGNVIGSGAVTALTWVGHTSAPGYGAMFGAAPGNANPVTFGNIATVVFTLIVDWPAGAYDRYVELTVANPYEPNMSKSARVRTGATPDGDRLTLTGVVLGTTGPPATTLTANVFQASGVNKSVSATLEYHAIPYSVITV